MPHVHNHVPKLTREQYVEKKLEQLTDAASRRDFRARPGRMGKVDILSNKGELITTVDIVQSYKACNVRYVCVPLNTMFRSADKMMGLVAKYVKSRGHIR